MHRRDQAARDAWPKVTFEVARDTAVATRLLSSIVERRPTALGITALAEESSARTSDVEPRCRARLAALAVACSADSDPESPIFVLDGDEEQLRSWIEPLFELADAPYMVFADAQGALHMLARLGLEPLRFGCLKTAATLLAEGADGRRDDRPLHWLVAAEMGLLLPDPNVDRERSLAASAEASLALMRRYTAQLRERRLNGVYAFECRLVPSVVAMEAEGMPVDVGGFERIASGWERERKTLGGRDADDETTARLRRLDKLISTYRWWARDHADADGRIRCRLDPLAADSGRFSCSSPNLQQVPAQHTAPGLRACFRAPDGWRLIIADYAQIELRVAAHMAPCAALREVFISGRDPHRATAATLTGKPESEISGHERQLAKAVNFGFLFGMGARRFKSYAQSSYGLSLSDAEAQAARDAFFATFPGIAAWHRKIGALGRRAERESTTVTTVMGRRKRFEAGEFSFNAALNIPVQGSAAEGFKLAMTRLRPRLADLGARGVLCVHDEYIAEAPKTSAEQAESVIAETMKSAMEELITSLPIEVETKIATSWGDEP